jgi:uncharacterized coiled-coil protein SlyX
LLQEFDESKRLQVMPSKFSFQENALNEIKLALKNPQDVIKAVSVSKKRMRN